MTLEHAWELMNAIKTTDVLESDTLQSMLNVADNAMGFDEARNAAVCIRRLVANTRRLETELQKSVSALTEELRGKNETIANYQENMRREVASWNALQDENVALWAAAKQARQYIVGDVLTEHVEMLESDFVTLNSFLGDTVRKLDAALAVTERTNKGSVIP